MNPDKASDFIAMLLENPEMDIEKSRKNRTDVIGGNRIGPPNK